MAYIPIIGPSIILIKISPSPDTSGKNIVERFYKLPIFINPAKRNVMVVKNEMRLLKQKRNVLQI